MTEYEKATLKLKVVELGQSQTLIALTALSVNSVEANIVADKALEILDAATDYIDGIIN